MPIEGASPINTGQSKAKGGGVSAIPGARAVSPDAPSFGDRADAFVAGLGSGATEALPFVGGALGATLGSALGPMGTAAGTALGVAGGEAAKRALRDFGVRAVTDLPEEERPFGYAGEVVGASVPFSGAPFVAAQRGARFASTKVGNFLNRIIETAQRRPVAFAATEASGIAGAAVGEGVAEGVAPGEDATRIVSGIVGGTLSPGQLTIPLANAGVDLVKRAASKFSRGARESRAKSVIMDILSETGEDPEALKKALREADIPGANRTSAQRTGSPALQVLEAELARSSAKFGGEARKRAEDSLEVIRKSIGALEASGDAAAIKEAANLKGRYFETLLQARVADAERRAVEAAGNITADTPQARAALSRKAEEIVSGALEQARKAEKELWSKVPKGNDANATSLIARANRIAAEERLVEEGLPDLVGRFVDRISDKKGATTVGELQLFRSRMLEKAREASSSGNVSDARVFGQMAEATLDDMIDAAGGSFTDAREFSRALNDTFTRTFAGQSVATGRTGAARVPPEAMMRRALGSGNELAAMRMRELEDAVAMGSPEALDEMLDVQQRLIRLAASEVVDPETGLPNARRLANFRRKNAELMERFPEIDSVLANAQSARRFFDSTTEQAKQARKAIERRAAFSRVTQAENPTAEIGRILSGGNPEREFRQLARLARQAGRPAVAGMRRAVIDDAFAKAGGDNDAFSFTAFRRALTEPRRPGQPSTLDMMKSNKVLDEATTKRLSTLLDEAAKVEKSIRTRPELESLLGEENAMFDLALRVIGSRIGAEGMMGQGSGATIVAAGAGSRFMRKVLDKVPQMRTMEVLVDAAENPAFMAALLEKPASQKDKIRLARQVHAYLWQAGLIRGPQAAAEGTEQQPNSMEQPQALP